MTNNVQEIQIPLMNNRKKEWIGAWPTCGSELVLGRIEKKSKNNKIRIEHWNHLIQNIGTTPTSNPPILIQCHGCKYSIPQEIQNSGNCHFWCESNSAIVVTTYKKRYLNTNDEQITLNSSIFEIKQKVIARINNNIN
ncbi:13612_t:CDS:2 [Entrophospora sp. SA101]|nr:10933_t:CDS:2 [Entrophospora sp. SA101]CAJ0923760.1 13612_t:CDS:2 [Entrophospora sp. SA101]